MSGYGSKYLNVCFKIRAYCLQICTANDEHKMFKTIGLITVFDAILTGRQTGLK